MQEPEYSFNRNYHFPVQRTTKNLNVAYYVAKAFTQSKSSQQITKLEGNIETDYIRLLQEKCGEEKYYMQNLRRQIQYSYSARMRDDYKRQLENLKTPWCDRLQNMVSELA